MTSVADCFEKGLLKKGVKQPDLARKDLLRSAFFLKEAQDMLEANKPVMAVLALYNALFHCARSLLFADGVTERSHHCVARYVDTQYVQTGKMQAKFLDAFETVMGIRHAAQYSTEEITIEEDLVELCALCEAFIPVAQRLLPAQTNK